jgi:hypothetical protein
VYGYNKTEIDGKASKTDRTVITTQNDYYRETNRSIVKSAKKDSESVMNKNRMGRIVPKLAL